MPTTDYTSQITAWYQAVQYRDPPAADLAVYNASLQSGSLTAADVQAAIVNSAYTATYVNPVIREYQAAFGRVPAHDGASFWVNAVASGSQSLDTLSTTFANSAEFTARFGATATTPANEALVTALYVQVYGRPPLTAGLTFWSNSGLTAAQLLKAFASAQEFLDSTATPISNFQSMEIAGNAPTTGSLFDLGGNQNQGQTFTLTTNLDAPGASAPSVNTQGTAGNDTYKAVVDTTNTNNTTLQATDDIDGAGGVDTLQIISNNTAANTVTPLFLKNVEKVSVKDVDAANSATVNLVNAAGVTEVINDGSLAAVEFQNIGTAAVTVQNVKTNVGTTFTRGSSPVTADLTINLDTLGSAAAAGGVAAVAAAAIASVDANNDATSVTINAKGYVAVDQVEVTGNAGASHTAQTVTINAAGKTIFGTVDGTADVIGFDTTKADKIVVKGAGEVQLNDLAGAVQTVDASANTGGVTLVGTTYTGTDATAAAAPGLNITGGSGKDSISVDGVASAVVNAGAGDDTVTLTTTHAAGAKIDGGDGTADRIVLTSAMADALDAQTTAGTNLRATLTGFEQLGIEGTLANDLNVAQAGSYNYLALNGDVTPATAVSGFTTGATVEFRNAGNQTAAINIGMTDAATSSTDSVTLKLNADLANGSTFIVRAGVQGINNVVIDANDRVDDVTDNDQALAANKDNSADDGYSLVLTNASNVNDITIKGTSAVSYTLQVGTDAVKLIDASASTGNVTIDVANFAGTERVEIKGSQGTNTIVGDNASFGEKITGGAKADSITGGLGADDMTGNGGRDYFIQGAGASGTTATTIDQISDFGKVTTAATAAEVGAMTNIATFQATATARGGANADVVDFTAVSATAVASDISTFTTGVLAGLEAVDATSTEFTGKDISLNSAKGLLTLSGSDKGMVDTLAEWVAVANLAAETNGETVAFEFSGNTYLFQQQAAGDEMIELTATTGVTGVVLLGGAVAASVGNIFIG